jgi:serine/threonine protein kinase/formylglycine-generating enzyme required for sulfatase activity
MRTMDSVPISLEQLIDRLAASSLMTAVDAKAVLESLPAAQKPCSGEGLAQELVRRKILSPYQSEILCAGEEIVFGNYVILDKLGQGGMGIVLKAEHTKMHRLVALKVLPDGALVSPRANQRFLREVEAAARLEHPNVVTAFDAGEANGKHFLAMQFVDGANLSEIVKNKGPMPVELAVRCIWQAAHGLAYAHQKGVIHRDIKPSNLILDSKGSVKVLDLGLARLDSCELDADKANLTNPGQIMGTVDFIAPEQALSSKAADARSDIYSLGITLWYLLTGKAVYDGDSLTARLLAHQQLPIPSLCAVCDEASPELESVFQKMVAKDPDERYSSMTNVLRALEDYTTGSASISTLRLEPSEDSSLNLLLEGLECLGASPTVTGSINATLDYSPEVKAEATVNKIGEDVDTDTKTCIPSDLSSPQSLDANVKRRFLRSRRFKLIAGIGVVALIATFIITNMRSVDSIPTREDDSHEKESTTLSAIAPFDSRQAESLQVAVASHLGVELEHIGSIGMKVRLVPPGEFSMGSPELEIDELVKQSTDADWIERTRSEAPQHRVSLSNAYYLGVYEVTQQQYHLVMKSNPSYFAAGGQGKSTVSNVDKSNHPVESVTWFDAIEFCNRLSEREGFPPYYELSDRTVTIRGGNGYRLPTAAEWEYACRAGTETPWYFGSDESMLSGHAWYALQANVRTRRVGQLKANPFGLYDMHGNVWEWCQDWHGAYDTEANFTDPTGPKSGKLRSLRGGSFLSKAEDTRAAYRDSFKPIQSTYRRGFRVARTPASRPTR